MRTHLTAVLTHTLSASSPTWHPRFFFNLLLLNNFSLPLFQFLLARRPILYFLWYVFGFFFCSFPFSSLLLLPRIPVVLVDDLSSSSRARWCIIESSLWIYHHPVVFVNVSSSCVCGFIIVELCWLIYHRVVLADLSSLSCVGGGDISSSSCVGGFIILESCWGLYHHGVA